MPKLQPGEAIISSFGRHLRGVDERERLCARLTEAKLWEKASSCGLPSEFLAACLIDAYRLAVDSPARLRDLVTDHECIIGGVAWEAEDVAEQAEKMAKAAAETVIEPGPTEAVQRANLEKNIADLKTLARLNRRFAKVFREMGATVSTDLYPIEFSRKENGNVAKRMRFEAVLCHHLEKRTRRPHEALVAEIAAVIFASDQDFLAGEANLAEEVKAARRTAKGTRRHGAIRGRKK
jgi:hypothetical protein